jgi:hypothetical protein
LVIRRTLFYLLISTSLTSAAVVETIDAETYEGDITHLDEKAVTIRTSDGEKKIPAEDLSKITFIEISKIPDLLKTSGQAVVLTQVGDVFPVRANLLRLGKNRIHINPGEVGIFMDLPINVLRSILLPATDQSPEDILRLCDEMKCSPGTKDQLLIVGKDDKVQKVSGTLIGMADGKITFSYQGKERTVKAGRVRAILLAEPTKAPPTPRGWFKTFDGCVCAFWDIKQTDAYYSLRRLWNTSKNISRVETASITFRSNRLVYFSDLKPVKVREHGMFDKVISFRVNRSASGGPLQMAGRKYDTGLGLHSFCELTYDLDKKYRAFIATAGIDDAVRPGGSATLTILADGKAILPATVLTGNDAPTAIRLSVRNAKTLTIRVDLGLDKLDAADHVDLVGARLVK